MFQNRLYILSSDDLFSIVHSLIVLSIGVVCLLRHQYYHPPKKDMRMILSNYT